MADNSSSQDNKAAVKLYYFPISPPSRAVHFFCLASSIKVELQIVNLLAGEQKKEEYLAINPEGKVPAINDNGFIMHESMAIIRYLANVYNSKVFPIGGDPVTQVAIDMVVEVIRSTIISKISTAVFNRAIAPLVGAPADLQAAEQAELALSDALSSFDTSHFKTSPNYILGDSITLADVMLATFIAQASMIKLDISPYPNIAKWYESMSKEDAFVKSHTPFFEALKKQQQS